MKLEQPLVDLLTQSAGSTAQPVELSPEVYAAVVRSIAAHDVDVDQLAADVQALRGAPRTLSFELSTQDDAHVALGHDLDDPVDAVKREGKVEMAMTESPADAHGRHGITLELRGGAGDVKAVEGRIARLARGIASVQAH